MNNLFVNYWVVMNLLTERMELGAMVVGYLTALSASLLTETSGWPGI